MDRAPDTTAFSVALTPSLYAIEFVSWEQGGQYVNELTWDPDGDGTFTTVPQSVFFTSAVPEPTEGAMLFLGLSPITAFARRTTR